MTVCRVCLAAGKPERESMHYDGEIWIPRIGEGGYYAAPVTICHYIEEHGYAPPPEFILALEKQDSPIPARRFFEILDALLVEKH